MTTADLIFVGGRIHTLDAGQPQAYAIAVAGDRITHVGGRVEVLETRGPRTEVIELGSRTLLPGFYDAHQHQLYAGLQRTQVDARVPDLATLVDRLRTQLDGRAEGSWIMGSGYDENRAAERRLPTRDVLDRASTVHPIAVTRTCGHVMSVNSAALLAAGVTRGTPDPEGGRVDRDENGEPTGVLRERAMQFVRSVVGDPDVPELVDAILAAAQSNLSLGITSIWEPSVEPAHIAAYERLESSGRLPLRVTMAQKKVLRSGEVVELAPPFRRTMLGLAAVKLFQDGALAPRTAALTDAYEGDADNRGLLYWSQPELDELVQEADRAGFQVSVHAIGDAAIASVLQAYAQVTPSNDADRRHRIEHCGLPLPYLHDRLRELGVVAVVQPGFLRFHGDAYAANVGGERKRWLYPIRTLLELCKGVAGSSDGPVIPDWSPLSGIASAMTRRTIGGEVLAENERLSFPEAVRLYTTGPAFAAHEEQTKGSLTPGKLADVVVLGADPECVDPEDLNDVPVEMTVVGGTIVSSRGDG